MIQDILRNHQSKLNELGVKNLMLFGSAARSQANTDSDLDFLVELEQYTFLNFMELKFSLEQWLGKTVDLGTFDQLKPAMRANVQKDLQRVA